MVALYFVIFREAKLYSDAGLQVFFAVVNLYGWWSWHRNKADAGEVVVRRLPALGYGFWIVGSVAAIWAWGASWATIPDQLPLLGRVGGDALGRGADFDDAALCRKLALLDYRQPDLDPALCCEGTVFDGGAVRRVSGACGCGVGGMAQGAEQHENVSASTARKAPASPRSAHGWRRIWGARSSPNMAAPIARRMVPTSAWQSWCISPGSKTR